MRVLVVDDSKVARIGVIKQVRIMDPEAEIVEAENGAIAVDLYSQSAFDIVFLDLTMPVMDGFEALAKIMAIDPDAKVIVVSADIQAKARFEVLKLGATSMIAKPISQEKMEEIFPKQGS
jgi:DNA-binding NarL/FixJ family response regulator